MYWEIKKLKNGKYNLFSTGTKVFRKPVTREQLTEWYVNHAAEAARIEVERLLRSADEKAAPKKDKEILKAIQLASKVSSPRPALVVWNKPGITIEEIAAEGNKPASAFLKWAKTGKQRNKKSP